MPIIACRVLWLVALACQDTSLSQPGTVRIVQRPAYQETEYEIRSGSCRIRWIVSHSGPSQGVVRHVADCDRPLKEQVELNAGILREVVSRESSFHTLFLGGLSRFPEVAQRLSREASRSAGWDSRSGRPRSGTAASFVADLANATDIFAEWRHMFAQAGLVMKVSSVEKVSLNAGKVPNGCLVWFGLRRAQDRDGKERNEIE